MEYGIFIFRRKIYFLFGSKHKLHNDVHKNGTPAFPLSILTFYEGMHLVDNRTIQYVSFRLPSTEIVVPPKKKRHEEIDL